MFRKLLGMIALRFEILKLEHLVTRHFDRLSVTVFVIIAVFVLKKPLEVTIILLFDVLISGVIP